ncbi:MAG: MmcQ/YjbR family DNA-binding protein [Phormidesmis sp.]
MDQAKIIRESLLLEETMERAHLERQLAGLRGAEKTYPFGPDPLVFKVVGKMFAYVSEDDGVPLVTVKCVPFDGEILVEQFKAITPGYHMNKRHWITISLTDEIPDDMLLDLVNKSYELVVKKLTKKDRAKLEAGG